MNNEEIKIDNQEQIEKTQINTTPTPTVEKKSKKWIFIVIGIILAIVLVFFILGAIRRGKNDDSLLKSKEAMTNDLSNFAYNSTISINVYGAVFDVNLNCKEDRVNKLGYCLVESNIANIEEYMDYNNKVSYTKSDLINNDGHTWKKSEEKNMDEVTPILTTLDNITIEKKEKVDNGTIYTGYLNGKSLSSIFNMVNRATSNKINIGNFLKKKIPVTVFVNNNNYVEKLDFSLKVIGIEINCNINYTDFNTSPSISLPEEINELYN